jgi:hypothetical protein
VLVYHSYLVYSGCVIAAPICKIAASICKIAAPMGKKTLVLAAQNGNLQKVIDLINIGYKPRVHNDLALVLASKNGHVEVVKYLVQLGANFKCYRGLPLKLALKFRYLDVTRYLLECFAPEYCIQHATSTYSMDKFLSLSVIDNIVQEYSFNSDVEKLFNSCLKTNNFEIMKCLIDIGYVPNITSSILMQNGYEHTYKIFRYMVVDLGADLSNCYEHIAHRYALFNNSRIIKLLVDLGYDLSERTLCGLSWYGTINELLFLTLPKRDQYINFWRTHNNPHFRQKIFSRTICFKQNMKHNLLKKILNPMSVHMQLIFV